MAPRQHVIELNGKKYDATTGKVVDGIVTKSKAAIKHKYAATTQRMSDVMPAVRKPQKSQTLMRTAVKKPVTLKTQKHATHRPATAARPVAAPVKSSKLADSIKPERAILASHIPKSKLISKFGAHVGSRVKSDIVPVRPAPTGTHHAHAAKAAAVASNTSEDIFEEAIRQATSHEQPRRGKIRMHHKIAHKLHIHPRTLIISSSVFVLLITGGFLAYNNVPNVAMRVAAARAGLSASLPAYHPAGFSLKGPIAYAPGEISVNYKSNNDSRDFKVVQRASTWNSEALLDNFVSTSDKTYQTLEANGRTIYIYDGDNATWVDGGIWFKIEGKSALNSDQLLRIANSL